MKTKLFSLLLFSSLVIEAQTYSISPAKTVSFTAALNNITINDIYQTNTGSTSITLKWESISAVGPVTWQYSMCDLGTCYPGLPAGPTAMNTVTAGAQGFLGLNVDPGNVSGTAIVKTLVYQNGFRANADTLIWYISTPPVGIKEIFANSGIKVFPNPAINSLNIDVANSEITTAKITDVSGRVFLNISLSEDANQVDISGLAKGFYMLTIETKGEQFFKRIIKE